MAKNRHSSQRLSRYLLALLTLMAASFVCVMYFQNVVKAEAAPNLTPSTNSASPTVVLWGKQITYTYTLINSGSANATDMDVFSELATGTSNPSNFTYSNCGGTVQNSSSANVVELSNVATTRTANCIITFKVTVDNPYGGPTTIVNEYYISPAAEGGPEVGPLTATSVTPVEPMCGNSILEPATEECDDGNLINNDGCSANCTIEICGDGIMQTGEACDDGNLVNGDGCSSVCVLEVACGDGHLDSGEACDDGNLTNGDGCSSQCNVEAACGDGNLDSGEACDDGNLTNGDGCSSACIIEIEEPEEPEECGVCNGKVKQLRLRYEGTESVTIRIEQSKEGVIFEEEVSPGEEFTINGEDKYGTLGPKIYAYENGGNETEIHTSCSVPIGPGQKWGNYMIMEGASRNGGNLCRLGQTDPPEPPEPPVCTSEPIANFYGGDIPCWAQDAVDWVIENELFNIYDEEDVRDAVKFYRFFQLMQD